MHQEPALGCPLLPPELSCPLFPKQILSHLTHLIFQPYFQEGVGLQSRVMDVLPACFSLPGSLSPCCIVSPPWFSTQTHGRHGIWAAVQTPSRLLGLQLIRDLS